MSLTWDEALFNAIYQIRMRDPNHPQFGQVLHYVRAGFARVGDPYSDSMSYYVNRWTKITQLFTIPTTDRILVAGCGFGWLIEAAKDAGWPNVYGIDNSPYVAANEATTSLPGQTEKRGDVVLVKENFTGGGAIKNALRVATGDDQFDWIISEDLLTSFTDAEVGVVLGAADGFLYATSPESNIIHLVPCVRNGMTGDSALNWHTLAEWAAMAPTHTWVDLFTWEVAP